MTTPNTPTHDEIRAAWHEGGNRAEAARRLGVGYQWLYAQTRTHRIDGPPAHWRPSTRHSVFLSRESLEEALRSRSPRTLATEIGVSSSAVYQWAATYGLPTKRARERMAGAERRQGIDRRRAERAERLRIMTEMRLAGVGSAEIADAVGIPVESVRRILWTAGIKVPKRVPAVRLCTHCGTEVTERARKTCTAHRRHYGAIPGVYSEPLLVENLARARQAAASTVADASAALESGVTLNERYVEVLQARVEHPDATLRELGEAVGMSKDVYAAALRRALASARRTATAA